MEITPEVLADLLSTHGPLPIRHITNHLTLLFPTFSSLSLLKQRRLIMHAISSPLPTMVFEKIGWGQWGVRLKDSNFVISPSEIINVQSRKKGNLGWKKKRENSEDLLDVNSGAGENGGAGDGKNGVSSGAGKNGASNDSGGDNEINKIGQNGALKSENGENLGNNTENSPLNNGPKSNNHPNLNGNNFSKFKNGVSRGKLRKNSSTLSSSNIGLKPLKRASISKKINDVNLPISSFNENVLTSDSDLSDSDNDSDNDLSESSDNMSDDEIDINMEPIFANRVPIYGGIGNGSNEIIPNNNFSRFSNRANSFGEFNLRFNENSFDHSNINNLDTNSLRINSFEEMNRSNTSITSLSPNYTSSKSRRKSSFNESHIRTKLSQNNISLPSINSNLKVFNDDTDEEDWATIGPESLRSKGITKKKIIPRKFSNSRSNSIHHWRAKVNDEIDDEERSAALTLVGLHQ